MLSVRNPGAACTLAHMRKLPAVIDGLAASTLQLPPGAWPTVLDCLCERFPAIGRAQWRDRFARGRVLGAEGCVLTAASPYRVGLEVHYYREVVDESCIPFEEAVLHRVVEGEGLGDVEGRDLEHAALDVDDDLEAGVGLDLGEQAGAQLG